MTFSFLTYSMNCISETRFIKTQDSSLYSLNMESQFQQETFWMDVAPSAGAHAQLRSSVAVQTVPEDNSSFSWLRFSEHVLLLLHLFHPWFFLGKLSRKCSHLQTSGQGKQYTEILQSEFFTVWGEYVTTGYSYLYFSFIHYISLSNSSNHQESIATWRNRRYDLEISHDAQWFH